MYFAVLLVCALAEGLSVPQGQWHNAENLESGTVILECKDGALKTLGEEDVMHQCGTANRSSITT